MFATKLITINAFNYLKNVYQLLLEKENTATDITIFVSILPLLSSIFLVKLMQLKHEKDTIFYYFICAF